MIKIDARGMSCPQPVLMVKKTVAKSMDDLEILVDNATAKNNVERFLKNSGYSKITFSDVLDDILISVSK
jgi:TusA-related sulfurtransferase